MNESEGLRPWKGGTADATGPARELKPEAAPEEGTASAATPGEPHSGGAVSHGGAKKAVPWDGICFR